MRENWNNNRLMLNGRVEAPIVLHNDKEAFIAQNTHNFIWGKYRQEFDNIEREINNLKEKGEDQTVADERMKNLNSRVKSEIDALIIEEINKHRTWQSNSCPLMERINELEEKLEKLADEIEDVRSEAEEAQSIAEEALEKAEEALEKAEESLDLNYDDNNDEEK